MATFEELAQKSFSFLGRNSFIEGEFNLEGVFRVASKIKGDIRLKESAKLIIEEEGEVEGVIRGGSVEIFGLFQGKLEQQSQVIIQATAEVIGQIDAQTISIFPGAIVNIQGDIEQKTTPDKKAEASLS